MHLKSVTLRGFKSFADPTTLEFEPGVTVVVGPNGSGKSNVVDAVAWVLGAQGPRIVRSSKMDDVIFAGTAKRPALGRAEVSITIDNSSRRLPVDLAEVKITRTLFRTGESEYSMNGASCRLLDIQELLSDAGVGRQQHVIMSQGQLASILDARPEDRRAVIEEAAGVLKYRRRRERAERRLDSTEANLLRLQDLAREVRRQLRPLERQAEAARRHGALVEELSALRAYLAGREVDSLQQRLGANEERRGTLSATESNLASRLARLDEQVTAGEAALSQEQASEVMAELSAAERLLERSRGVANVIEERRRRVEAALQASSEADVVSSLEAEAARLAREIELAAAAAAEFAPEAAALEERQAELERAALALPQETRGEEGTPAHELRAARDAALRELAQAREQLARAGEQLASAVRQRRELDGDLARLTAEAPALAEAAAAARAALAAAERAESQAADEVTRREQEARQAAEEARGLHARAEALREALGEAHTRAGLERLAGRPGVLGTLADVVAVEPGYERAFEAAVEESLTAVVVLGLEEAKGAIAHLQSLGSEGAVLPAGLAPEAPTLRSSGAESLRGHVRGTRPGLEGLLDGLLSGVVVAGAGIAEAVELAAGNPGAVVVTRQGDRLSPRGWRLGAGREGATRDALESVEASLEGADRRSSQASGRAEAARAAWQEARAVVARTGREAESAGASERQSAGALAAARQRLGGLEAEMARLEAAEREAAERVGALEALQAEKESLLRAAEEREQLLRQAAETIAEARRQHSERLQALARDRAEFEVRSASTKERRQLLSARLAEIERRLAGHEAAREDAGRKRRAEESQAVALARLAALVSGLSAEIARTRERLSQERRQHDDSVRELADRLSEARRERSGLERELASLREQSQRAELERAELRVRLETALEHIRRELDLELSECLAAPCPELPPGTPPPARVRELERELRLLGPINPLALEELSALEERDSFLSAQLEDVKSTRRELGRVMKAIDEEIVAVFSEAFADVAGHFEQLFSTLFPGGAGRLVLVDPSDLLGSGIEIEARPAGRNVRRLSLLSGGERSLVALAFLFAVFRSRPSPFYLMDEVEAALDDINLHRFLDLVEEFRQEAQLVIVSHQKRTMESADVIYGVTMQPGGASKVVGEKLRGAPASA